MSKLVTGCVESNSNKLKQGSASFGGMRFHFKNTFPRNQPNANQ